MSKDDAKEGSANKPERPDKDKHKPQVTLAVNSEKKPGDRKSDRFKPK